MKIKNGFVIRSVGGENVVVPVGEMSKQFHGMINLNETGAFLWRFFSEEHSHATEQKLVKNDIESIIVLSHILLQK